MAPGPRKIAYRIVWVGQVAWSSGCRSSIRRWIAVHRMPGRDPPLTTRPGAATAESQRWSLRAGSPMNHRDVWPVIYPPLRRFLGWPQHRLRANPPRVPRSVRAGDRGALRYRARGLDLIARVNLPTREDIHAARKRGLCRSLEHHEFKRFDSWSGENQSRCRPDLGASVHHWE